MSVEKVLVFKTSDGTMFDSESAAIEHDNLITCWKWVQDNYEDSYSEVVLKEFEDFVQVVKKIRSVYSI